ncbi:hypothetical protein LguiB_009678 [Lonicera macranthoides]
MASTANESLLKKPDNVKEEEEESTTAAADTTGGAEEEDTGAQIAPIIKLQEVAVSTGEENELVLLDLKAKLYRFDKEGNQWKERGVGTVKLLKHNETSKVRLVMRQSKTLKICANHLMLPSISLQEHAGSDKSCVWHASDYADGELKEELFAIRFPSVENCKTFKEKVEEVAKSHDKKSAEEATSALEKLSVADSKDEEEDKKTKETTPISVSADEKKEEEVKKESPAEDK